MTLDLLIAAVCGLGCVAAAWFVPARIALSISVVLAVLQVYVTRELQVSLGAIWQLAAWVTVFRARAGIPRIRAARVLYGLLVLVSALVIAWSVDRSAGATLVVQLLGFGATACLALICARTAPAGTSLAYGLLAGLVAISSVTTFVFRYAPAIEHQYFVSSLFGFLNGQDTAAHFFTTQRNNALDDLKSGGLFFVNANVASLFHGTAAVLLGGRVVRTAARGRGRTATAVVALVSLATTIPTGSKTAIYIGAGVCVLLALLIVRLWWRSSRRRAALGAAGLALLAAVLLVVIPVIANRLIPFDTYVPPAAAGTPQPSASTAPTGLAVQSADAANTRFKIWSVGAEIFQHDPIGTLGYGGWHQAYAPLAAKADLNPTFPPHDWIIETWSETGPIGVALVVALLVLLGVGVRRRWRGATRVERLAIGFGVLSIGWVLVHGLADNTGFYGGPRLIPVVALALALVLVGPDAARPEAPGAVREPAGAAAGRTR